MSALIAVPETAKEALEAYHRMPAPSTKDQALVAAFIVGLHRDQHDVGDGAAAIARIHRWYDADRRQRPARRRAA